MEVWSSSGREESERESSISQDEEDEEEQEQSTNGLCRELVKVLCAERVGQVTKTYRDIEAVTHLLEEKERDLELAARIGQSLLKQNKSLTERNELLDEQLEVAKEEIAQLRHELSMRDDLLQLYAGTEEMEAAAQSLSPIRRNESSSSLSNYVHYDFLQTKLKSLEEENLKLRTVADELTSETSSYEEQEQQLMIVCVEELSSANKQVVAVSEELARKVEDSFRQQEEISSLLGQVVDLQQRCKVLIRENEELTQHLNTSRESQSQLKTELKDLKERYSECEDMLQEAREDIKNLRNKSLPNSTVQRYSSLAAVFPMDSIAAEIEGTFRKGLDSPAPSEYRTHPWRVFETVKVANQVARLRFRCHSPQVPSSSPNSSQSSPTGTPGTSYYGSDSVSVNLEDKPHSITPSQEQSLVESKRLGQPGRPGGQDLEEALRSLSARQKSHSSDRPFFDVERERKLRALGGSSAGDSSGFLTPNDSLESTGTNYSGSSQHSSASSRSQSYLPERLQIVKPLEGSVTLHHWQQLAKPNLGGILLPRPGILTKDFRELDVDVQQVYSLNDFEEDEPNWSKLHNPIHIPTVTSSGSNFPHTCPTHTITNSQILHPSVLLSSLSTSFQPHNLSTSGSSEHVRTLPDHQHGFSHRPAMNTTPTLSLIQLLQERGISASTQPSLPPILRPSTSTLAALNDKERDGGRRGVNQQRRNIFSFNLVDKLQCLGLHKVIARGLIGSGKMEGDPRHPPPTQH
ncbi:trafficking kinesin-binding protein 1 isoform X1 [Ictalurus punctatus]|uniref:Trafficking kinesin-binding protein 1 isoform X1 n=1 Tax=Ictalurus punctatus TaxID=7998 RepID=A0A2D0RS20_ICTPU|nr:trafficking kinesin-binding protein 1 isoform X1 [Ictalurus punctatus]